MTAARVRSGVTIPAFRPLPVTSEHISNPSCSTRGDAVVCVGDAPVPTTVVAAEPRSVHTLPSTGVDPCAGFAFAALVLTAGAALVGFTRPRAKRGAR
jgi:hypothetical protein